MDDRHVALLGTFFEAFRQGDTAAMERCYHPDVSFGDPLFQELDGRDRVMAMWRLVLSRGSGIEVTYRDLAASSSAGSARWTARYTLTSTGREVVNEVEAFFRFEDGLIVRHHDDFDFRHWSRMALGKPAGLLLGWTPMFRKTIRDRAHQALDEFQLS
ncbi:nuclear transport factor 2 family protein [Nonomuraea sp. NPDC059194]|uniref:nuclear transport factor 2 family protein n=1 Tax=Nonomuraea sp. NPDC059194 TaxID=3346764 RepID=UPI0036CA92B4